MEVNSISKKDYGNVSDIEVEFSVDYDRDQFHPNNSITLVCSGSPSGYMDAFELNLDEPPKTIKMTGRLVPNRFGKAGITCSLVDKDNTLIAADSIEIPLP